MPKRLNPKRIPISGPSITQKEIDYVTDAVTRAWYENANIYHDRFEKAFAAHTQRKHAMALPSCTSAIHLALLALGIGPGDEVIVPDITWIASAAPISYVGATPVFADVDPVTWCLTPDSVRSCLNRKTRAIIAVDLYGNMPDLTALCTLAADEKIALIEDAAEALGAKWREQPAGSFGTCSVFSFHGSKTVTTGEGGMLVTDDPALYQRALFLRDHGRPAGDKFFYNTEVAYKYKMSSMQAALGLAQMERLEELVTRKRQIFSWYQQALADYADITLNQPGPSCFSTYWMITAIFKAGMAMDKVAVINKMSEFGVDCRPFFHPLSSLPAYANLPSALAARAKNSVSYDLNPRGINLPSGLNLTKAEVYFVTECLREVLA